MTNAFEPKILAFLCNWCAYAGADLAGVSRFIYPPTLRVIRVMCSGRIDPLHVVEGHSRAAVLGGRGWEPAVAVATWHTTPEPLIALETDTDEVRILVGDTGSGIPAEILPNIFEPFFSTKDEVKGVGLGLSVVYGIVRGHGGDIAVTAEVDHGKRVRNPSTSRYAPPRSAIPRYEIR